MLFKQFVDEDLGCASYLVGDEQAGSPFVVDPAYGIEPYLEEASGGASGYVAVLETHTHADHVSATAGSRSSTAFPSACTARPARRSARAARGRHRDRARRGRRSATLHTPGHRPEHCAFAVIDRSRADEPWLVLTGDSLFVGDAARPDLAVEALDGAEELFDSLRRLVDLGDGVEVYPGPCRGLALRCRDELEGVDDDRLRAAIQPCARRRRTRSSSARAARPAAAATAEHGVRSSS